VSRTEIDGALREWQTRWGFRGLRLPSGAGSQGLRVQPGAAV